MKSVKNYGIIYFARLNLTESFYINVMQILPCNHLTKLCDDSYFPPIIKLRVDDSRFRKGKKERKDWDGGEEGGLLRGAVLAF